MQGGLSEKSRGIEAALSVSEGCSPVVALQRVRVIVRVKKVK